MFSICFIHVLHFQFFNFRDCFQLVFHGFLFQLVFFQGWIHGQNSTQMLASILKVSRTIIDCKHKFNKIYKQYKDDKIVNGILGNDHYECPFYNALDSQQHQSGNVMKHVNSSTNETEKIVGNFKSQFFFIVFQRMKVVRNQWRNLSPHMRLKNKTKKKSLMCMNIFQPWLKLI